MTELADAPDPGDARVALIRATVATLGVGVVGTLGLPLLGLHEYGFAMFVLTPTVAGFAAGTRVRTGPAMATSVGASLVLYSVFALVTGFEGLLCVLLASPLVVVLAFVGALLGQLVRRRYAASASVATPAVGVMLILALGGIEGLAVPPERELVVESSIEVPADADAVWTAIVEVDRIDGPLPWLMRVGLPTPRFCELQGTGVGATRICHFDEGTIEERVTEWEPGVRLGVEITAVTLPGRHWLSYVDADYELAPTAVGTRIIRRTRLTSVLQPRVYWERLERWGTETEHDYLLESVRRSLEEAGS